MDKIEKLLRAIPQQDRIRIEGIIAILISGEKTKLKRKKLVGFDCIYRIRVGRYRIFYYDDGNETIIKAIKKRDESTYSKF